MSTTTGERTSPGRGRATGARRTRVVDPAELLLLSITTAALVAFVAFSEGGLEVVFRQQFGVLLLWGLALLLAFGVLPRARLDRDARRVFVAFALLAAWVALSLLWAESVERALVELGRLLIYAGAVAAVLLAASRASWTAVAAGVSLVLLVVPAFAVVSFSAPGSLLAGPLDSFDRLSYPLGYWNALAGWAAMAVVTSLALSVGLRDRALRALTLGAFPVAGLCLYLTFSRGGAVAALLGVGALLLLAPRPRRLGRHLAAGLVATAVLIGYVRVYPELLTDGGSAGGGLLALTAVAAIGCGQLARRRRSRDPQGRGRAGDRLILRSALVLLVAAIAVVAVAGSGERPAGAPEEGLDGGYPAVAVDPADRLTTLEGSRPEVWGSTVGAFASSPLLGIGPGSFEFWYTRDVPGGEQLRQPHSLYLGQLAELGIPGLVLLLGLLGSLLVGALRATRRLVRRSQSALALAMTVSFGVFLVQASIDWLWQSTALTLVALVGVASVLASATEPLGRSSRGLSGARRALAVGLAVLAGASLIPGAVSVERVRASFVALSIGRDERATELADAAITAQPWAAAPYAARALARVEAGDYDAAEEDALVAIRRERTNWRHQLLMAGIQARLGDQAGADGWLGRARELNPGLTVEAEDLLPSSAAETGVGEGSSP